MQWFLIFPGPSSDLRCFLKILFLSLIEHGEQFNLAPSQECWLGYYSDVERSAAFSCTPCRTQTVRSYSLSKDSSFPRNAGSQKQKLTNIAVFFFAVLLLLVSFKTLQDFEMRLLNGLFKNVALSLLCSLYLFTPPESGRSLFFTVYWFHHNYIMIMANIMDYIE